MSYSFGRELHLLAVNLDDPLDQIDRQPAGDEHRALALLLQPVPERHPDAGGELVHAEGLGHIVVGAELQRPHDPRLVGTARQHHHRQVEAFVAPAGEEIVPRNIGQAEIEEDQVRPLRRERFERELAVAGFGDRIALRPEPHAQQLADRRFVVDDEDLHA
jgi:hypothetical protein